MTQDTKEVARGRTGDTVPRSGQYAATGCCGLTKELSEGDLFPACPAHGESTEWGRLPRLAREDQAHPPRRRAWHDRPSPHRPAPCSR
jgi:hypothetical protein